MKCPKCHAEVAEWHFYCGNCHALLSERVSNVTTTTETAGGIVERAGRRVLDLVFVGFILGILILMAREIEWNSLLRAFRDEMGSPAQTPRPRNLRNGSTRRSEPAITPTSTPIGGEDVGMKPDRTGKAESVRSLPNPIEELPAADEAPAGPPESASASVASFAKGISAGGDGEHANSSGFLAVSSYTPARIYVDGKFWGLTPRTVRLAAGAYQLRLIAAGYEDWIQQIQLKRGQQIGIMASMTKKTLPQK
jgi:PEGA domain